MLKNLLNLKQSKKTENDKMEKILDGYVDIKIYDCKDKDNKKLIYHDTGDNTVTIWMKQVILKLLAGINTSSKGENLLDVTHNSETNGDGSTISSTGDTGKFFINYGEDNNKTLGGKEIYSLLPTKVLLGTGKEYTDWNSLKSENFEKNPKWYQEMVNIFGEGESNNFNSEQYGNDYSATITEQGHYSLTSTSIPDGYTKAVTVEDPDGNKLNTMPSDMSRRIGVVGAIKTPANGDEITNTELSSVFLNSNISDSGRLLQPKYRGVGKPCFLYFERYNNDGTFNEIENPTNNVSLSKESGADIFNNKLTFKIILPAQSSTSEYYPYNGYTLKQIGLFNDAYLSENDSEITGKISKSLMPHGTLLAVKDLAPFTKTSTSEVSLTWTLTI